MILKDTDELVRLTNTPAADIDVLATWVDLTVATGAVDAGSNPQTFTTAQTNTAIVASPGAGVRRKVKYICITNRDSTDSTAITINYTDGTTSVEQFRTLTLAPEESLIYTDGTWFVYDANGGVKTDAALASDTAPGRIQVATQAEMEAATSTTVAVTPGRQHFHPGMLKAWVDCVGAGTTINASYNITSLTDTGAGQVTVNIATDFSAANYAVTATVERASTALAVTNLLYCAVRNATQLAGSTLIECWDGTATTATQEDPSSYFAQWAGDQ